MLDAAWALGRGHLRPGVFPICPGPEGDPHLLPPRPTGPAHPHQPLGAPCSVPPAWVPPGQQAGCGGAPACP